LLIFEEWFAQPICTSVAASLSAPTSGVTNARANANQPNNLAVNSYYAPAAQIEQQQVLRNNAGNAGPRPNVSAGCFLERQKRGRPPSRIESNVAEGTVKPIWLGDAWCWRGVSSSMAKAISRAAGSIGTAFANRC